MMRWTPAGVRQQGKLMALRRTADVAQKRMMGALTSKPYAFTARPWELRRTDTVDTVDGMGSWIQVHSKAGEVMRVQPRENEELNEEWIHDKTRYSYDGLKRQRLTRPLVRGDNGWDENKSSWRVALQTVKAAIDKASAGGRTPNVRALCGPAVDLYAAVALTDWIAALCDGKVESVSSRGSTLGADVQSQYRFNSTVRGLEEADFCLLVGTDLNAEAPLLEVRLRKMFLRDTVEIVSLGMPQRLSFPIASAGLTAGALVEIAEGRHPVCAKLASAHKPAIIVGAQVLEREDGATLAGALETIAELSGNVRQVDPVTGECTWNGLNVLHHAANDAGLLDLGRTVPFDASRSTPPDVLFLMGVNSGDLPVSINELIGENTFVVVQGSHGDEIAACADVVLPGAAFTEKSGIYVNFEGRVQKARNAITPPIDGREDWKVIRALSEVCGPAPLPFDTEGELRERVAGLVPTLERRNRVSPASAPSVLFGPGYARLATSTMAKGTVNDTPFRPRIYDFYVDGSVVAGSSQVMARSSVELNVQSNFVEFPF